MTSVTDDPSGVPEASPPVALAEAEARVEAHSASLRKELGVRDLVLTQILFIVGLTWIGVAGKLGPAHVVFWLLAIVLFYLPSAAVVMYLNRLMPLEGGLYQWAKLGFNETAGFLLNRKCDGPRHPAPPRKWSSALDDFLFVGRNDDQRFLYSTLGALLENPQKNRRARYIEELFRSSPREALHAGSLSSAWN